jgi:hypothetical protein
LKLHNAFNFYGGGGVCARRRFSFIEPFPVKLSLRVGVTKENIKRAVTGEGFCFRGRKKRGDAVTDKRITSLLLH